MLDTMTDLELAEGIYLDDWKLTCRDVELSDAERAFVREDMRALKAEQHRRDAVHNAREDAQTVAV
jgi:hypothetical protein